MNNQSFPVTSVAQIRSGILDPENALELLKTFYQEVKKEIKKKKKLKTEVEASGEICGLSFHCDGFDLHFRVKGGMV